MAGAPRFKVYDHEGEYRAACKYVEDAAALVGGAGCNGWTIRDGHAKRSTFWTESDECSAGESYDEVHRAWVHMCDDAFAPTVEAPR